MKWGPKNNKKNGYQFITLCLGGTITATLVSERKHSEANIQTQNFKYSPKIWVCYKKTY